ncbi:MAG: hypothetical protein LBD82_08715 [Deltaproteobacteria bacterium]|jgi:hypothetical protein|nr:hypothetical protein [Deltaproteobacteria bacterium]
MAQPSEGWPDCLAGDRQGEALRRLRDILAAKRARLRDRLAAGVAPEEFALGEKLLAALDAADAAALVIWEEHNKN